MPFILTTRHTVEDYGKWKAHFDSHTDVRKRAGEQSYQIFHGTGDPNDLVLFFEWDSLDHFKKYLQSEQLRASLAESGVVTEPQITFLERVETGHP
jgi:quinol monooxygenase YgiN